MIFGSAIAAGIYVFISSGISMESLKSLVMALAYCWGLILAIYLMGHGLVAIPRRLFRNASLSGKLKRIQSNAAKVHEKMEDAIQNLEDLEAQVVELSQRKTGSARYVLLRSILPSRIYELQSTKFIERLPEFIKPACSHLSTRLEVY